MRKRLTPEMVSAILFLLEKDILHKEYLPVYFWLWAHEGETFKYKDLGRMFHSSNKYIDSAIKAMVALGLLKSDIDYNFKGKRVISVMDLSAQEIRAIATDVESISNVFYFQELNGSENMGAYSPRVFKDKEGIRLAKATGRKDGIYEPLKPQTRTLVREKKKERTKERRNSLERTSLDNKENSRLENSRLENSRLENSSNTTSSDTGLPPPKADSGRKHASTSSGNQETLSTTFDETAPVSFKTYSNDPFSLNRSPVNILFSAIEHKSLQQNPFYQDVLTLVSALPEKYHGFRVTAKYLRALHHVAEKTVEIGGIPEYTRWFVENKLTSGKIAFNLGIFTYESLVDEFCILQLNQKQENGYKNIREKGSKFEEKAAKMRRDMKLDGPSKK